MIKWSHKRGGHSGRFHCNLLVGNVWTVTSDSSLFEIPEVFFFVSRQDILHKQRNGAAFKDITSSENM